MNSGENKRVSVAIVLSMDPYILARYEPAAEMDPSGRRESTEPLSSLHITRPLVKHDLNVAR